MKVRAESIDVICYRKKRRNRSRGVSNPAASSSRPTIVRIWSIVKSIGDPREPSFIRDGTSYYGDGVTGKRARTGSLVGVLAPFVRSVVTMAPMTGRGILSAVVTV